MLKLKYPRTPHLPFSPGKSNDDIVTGLDQFLGKEIVITEKLDGENSTLTNDYYHARSLDSQNHVSRTWLKNYYYSIRHNIPSGLRIHGENVYAVHSIKYNKLPIYFIVFGMSDNIKFFSIDETLEWCKLLDLKFAPILYQGVLPENIKQFYTGQSSYCGEQEGFVVRLANEFKIEDFSNSVAKFVRKDHIQTDDHWMYKTVEVNGLK